MKRLQRDREARNWTRFELGSRARVNPPRVGQIESGRAVPKPDSIELIRLAAALGYDGDPADLLDDVTEMRGAS
jgi:transcriptional regulator with XRE-family HTH domain